MKASGIKYDGKAAKTAPLAAVDVLGAASEIGVMDTGPPLPDPDPDPPLRLLCGDHVLDPGIDEEILKPKSS